MLGYLNYNACCKDFSNRQRPFAHPGEKWLPKSFEVLYAKTIAHAVQNNPSTKYVLYARYNSNLFIKSTQ